jgi:hypothetical protein
MARLLLILILGTFITFGIANISLNENVTRGTENASDNYSLTKARNIANSTAEMIFSYLGDNINWRVNSPTSRSVLGGTATYTVQDAFFSGDSLIKISITGNYQNSSKPITVYTLKSLKSPEFIPPGIKAAITANNKVLASGTITIDGRDHAMATGNLIPQKGTYGIWTTDKFVQQGAAKIGGTYYLAGVGIDIAPTTSGYMPVVAEYQTYPGGFPTTPEQVMGDGYPPGTLKVIAKQGLLGSQYVTNPASLSYPLKGITYLELPPAGTWTDMSIDGSGILIVHNNSRDAVMKNLNSGTFRGLIIADDIVHIHGTIIGALVSLTPNPSEGNSIGNGSGFVKYSKEAILYASGFATNHNFGFGSKRVAIKYWFE